MDGWGARAVSVRYRGRPALTGVDFALPAGQVVAVVGGDGAGKSTLLRCLVGTVPIDEGEVRTPPLDEMAYMATVGAVWRDLSVDENVQFVGGAYGLRGAALRERADVLLASAGLDDVRGRLAGRLSGGMRQKLAFTLAMLHRPRLLLLDEPSTGVDPVSRVELWRLIAQAAAGGAAVAMATTYLDEAERASRVLVLDAGRPVLSGPPEQVMAGAPGWVRVTDVPADPARAWRRGRTFHEWRPGSPPPGSAPLARDMEDAVISAVLAAAAADGGAR